MKERRKDTKKQKEERRHRDVMQFVDGYNMGFAAGYEIAKKEKGEDNIWNIEHFWSEETRKTP
jgi:hypothetical protein